MKHKAVYCNMKALSHFRRYQGVLINLVDLIDDCDNSLDITPKNIQNILTTCEISEKTLKKYLREMISIGLLIREGNNRSMSFILHPYYVHKEYLKEPMRWAAVSDKFIPIDDVMENYTKMG